MNSPSQTINSYPPIVSFARQTLPRKSPRPSNLAAKSGLVFERKVFAELQKSFEKVEHNPWFEYRLLNGGFGICCPDILIWDPENKFIVVIEVKQTWIPHAISKLRGLYCPIIEKALSLPTKPLVIAKNLIPESPKPMSSISLAIQNQSPLIQWRGIGPIFQ